MSIFFDEIQHEIEAISIKAFTMLSGLNIMCFMVEVIDCDMNYRTSTEFSLLNALLPFC